MKNNKVNTETNGSYLFKKSGTKIVPVKDKAKNERAKKKIDKIFNGHSEFNIPDRISEKKDDIVLYHSKGDVEKARSLFIKSEKSTYHLSNKLNDMLAKEWLQETITVFSQKGLGASNKDAQIEKLHPAPFSFQDVARHIRFFTKEKDRVLDPFLGVGSTLKACAFENRLGYGIELNKKYAELSKLRIEKEVPSSFNLKNNQTVINGDAINEINNFDQNYFDFIITSPPYWDILDTKDHKANERVVEDLDTKYSDDDKDLANIVDYDEFLEKLSDFFSNCSSTLKRNKYMAIIVSDFRKKDKYYLFHADLAKKIENKSPFKLKGIRILYQRHKSIYPYGYPYSFVPNVHHQNVLIFQNFKK